MEPYRKIYRRKPSILEPLTREQTECRAAPAPLSKQELCAIGQIGTGPEVEFTQEDEPEKGWKLIPHRR
jgi:hypothetical protein